MIIALVVAAIPSPGDNAVSLGPLQLRAYGLAIAGVRVNIWVSLIAIASSLVALTVLRHRQRTESRADPAHDAEPHPAAP